MLRDKTLFITGATRGIGKAIAMRAAKEGANIIVASKTTHPHPKLPGTIFSAAEDLINAGAKKALPLKVDIRDEEQVKKAFDEASSEFGHIDVLVNNASAIYALPTEKTPMKRYDLMMDVNVRGAYLCSRTALPLLKKSENPHILNLSPPLNMSPQWFGRHVAYTISKYGMSMCVLGMAEEFRQYKIAVNALWPKTVIATAALQALPIKIERAQCRKDTIVADAAYHIFCQDSKQFTGNFLIDEQVIRTFDKSCDLSQYAYDPTAELLVDFFVDE